jgi:hypothetical protein
LRNRGVLWSSRITRWVGVVRYHSIKGGQAQWKQDVKSCTSSPPFQRRNEALHLPRARRRGLVCLRTHHLRLAQQRRDWRRRARSLLRRCTLPFFPSFPASQTVCSRELTPSSLSRMCRAATLPATVGPTAPCRRPARLSTCRLGRARSSRGGTR